MVVELARLQNAIEAAVAYTELDSVPVPEAVVLTCDYLRIDDKDDRALVQRLVANRLRMNAHRGLKEARR